jgi:hypothetical protein
MGIKRYGKKPPRFMPDGYLKELSFANQCANETQGHRIWIDFYFRGEEPLLKGQRLAGTQQTEGIERQTAGARENAGN